jgi:hypothetical protein
MKRFINLKTTCLLLLIVTTACNTEECGYCSPSCNLLTDFEDQPIGSAGNWQAEALASVEVQIHSGSKKLRLVDASGASSVFNERDFPTNLINAGCEFSYDVEYDSGSTSNLPTASNSLIIYQGAFNSFTSRAIFVLNSSNLIASLVLPKTIKVPLALASGTSLPSNSYGAWVLAGGSSTPTPADIANFNALIQNIDGISFFIDSGSNPSEIWWYDNFCFTQCCPQ